MAYVLCQPEAIKFKGGKSRPLTPGVPFKLGGGGASYEVDMMVAADNSPELICGDKS